MSLTVLSVGYPLACVGPDAVGGAEQILSALDDALVRAGHRSLVIAPEGSVCRGELRATRLPSGPIGAREKTAAHAAHRDAIARVLASEPVDVVHLHGVDYDAYLPPPGVPALVTLHLPPGFYPAEALAPRPGVHLHAVSASQARSCPAGARLLPHVDNGVDLARFRRRGRPRHYAIVLSRVCPEKGIHLAIDAARRAGIGLVLGGQVHPYPEHEAHFRDEIAPRLGHGVVFAGALGGARKERLLASAHCLLVPSLVPETSSLVAMEALASGTPVVAFRIGALPEIVEHGRTGFLVDSVDEMADAIRAAGTLDRATCRAAAEARFSRERMTQRYLSLYRRLARTARRGAEEAP